MVRTFLTSFLVIVLLGLVGCAGSARLSSLLPGSSWTVERIVYPTGDIVRGDGETLAFDVDGSLYISSCNSCGGTYQMTGGRIEFSVGACTLRACAAGVIELEQLIAPQMKASRSGEYLILAPVEAEEGPQIMLLPAPASRAPVREDRPQSP